MIQFFQSILTYIELFIGYFAHTLSVLLDSLVRIASSFVYVGSVIAYLPAYLKVVVLALVSTAMIYLIIDRG